MSFQVKESRASRSNDQVSSSTYDNKGILIANYYKPYLVCELQFNEVQKCLNSPIFRNAISRYVHFTSLNLNLMTIDIDPESLKSMS